MSAATLAPTATATAPGRPRTHVLADTLTMVRRCTLLMTREIDSLVMAVVLPVMLMLLFVYVFGGAITTGTDYIDYVTPGIILLTSGFGAASTAVAVQQDLALGVVDRFRSMPVAAWTLLAGHVVASVLKNLVTTGVVFGVAFALGFRPDASLLGWVGAIATIVLWVLAITSAATLVGVVARTADSANAATFVMLFLPYVSSAFVPPESMPSWLRGFAEHQPVTSVIETVRGLLTGTPIGSSAALAVAWCVGIGLVFGVAAAVVFSRGRRR